MHERLEGSTFELTFIAILCFPGFYAVLPNSMQNCASLLIHQNSFTVQCVGGQSQSFFQFVQSKK